MDSFYELPNLGVFVGRDLELAQLARFLSDVSSTARPIMLVYGPRGVGKSALVCEAAKHGIKQEVIKRVAWLDRARAAELLFSDEFEQTESNQTVDPPDNARISRYIRSRPDHQSRQTDEENLHKKAVSFLKAMSKSEPHLWVIDDFDEFDGLDSDTQLCERLSRVQLPNKVILTTRLPRNRFAQLVYDTLEVGLLRKEEVKALVRQCGLDKLNPVQLVNDSLEATAEYIWRISGGLPEFIVRFLVPLAIQNRWLIETDPKWRDAFECFSAGYLVQRDQGTSLEEYRRKFRENVETFVEEFHKLDSSSERYVLMAMATEGDMQALEEQELAPILGYRPEDREEFSLFHSALYRLHERRMIGCRLESPAQDKGASEPTIEIRKWTPLPFASCLLRSRLLEVETTNMSFHREQANRWIRFSEGCIQSPRQIEQQLNRICASFLWCFENQEWTRVVQLGKLLSEALQELEFHVGGPDQRSRLVEICQKTAEAAQQLEISDWQTAIDQWLLLARLYSSTDDNPELLSLALRYAMDAVRRLDEAKKTETIDRVKWANAACLVARICVQNGDIVQAENWLERVEKDGQVDEDWAVSAYVVAKLHLLNGKVDESQCWFNKVLISGSAHGNFEIAAQAGVDLAHIHLGKKDLEQASLFVRRVRETAEQHSPSAEIVALLVKAVTIDAQIAYQLGKVEDCIRLLEEAIGLSKEMKLSLMVEELTKWLNFIRLRGSEFDPATSVDRLLGARLLWGAIEGEQKCPVCLNRFTPEDLFESRLWLCSKCDTYVHSACLDSTDGKCPVCQTPQVRMPAFSGVNTR